MPDTFNDTVLRRKTDTSGAAWNGRLHVPFDGWEITLDARQDYMRCFRDAEDEPPYALTHVMEIRRTDRSNFATDEAGRLIEALRVAFSFAAGRFVAPALVTGFSNDGAVIWQSWTTPICDPYQPTGSPVVGSLKPGDLQEFVRLSVAALLDGNGNNTTRFQMILATQTANLGFMENRIFSAFPAIENLAWGELRFKQVMSGNAYEKLDLCERLEKLLILHSIGYTGGYQRSIPPFGWAGGVEAVPWAP